MKVTVYSRGDCVQCTATTRLLQSKGIEFEAIDLDTMPGSVSWLQSNGFRALPVVAVNDVPEWAGFDPAKINKLTE